MRFVPAESLKEGMILARDIVNTSNNFVLKKGVELKNEYILFLMRKGYLGAYIVDPNSEDVEVEEAISPKTLVDGLKALEESNVDSLLGVAAEIVADISKMGRLSIDLLDLRSFDDYTYHHSVNVAVYAVAVGMKMGLSKEKLALLSMAGISHDLGKASIPEGIISKNGALTDEEYALIKQHPKFSFDILYKNPEIPAAVRQAVLFHHENENGTGYPMGKESAEIPLMAKIIHAVDVYDALTSKRPYKNPYTPVAAFDYMRGGKGILFNPSVVDIMEQVIPAYPPGIDVVLSNGEKALVISHSSNARRPIISIDGKVVNLNTDEFYQDVFIKNSGILPLDYTEEVTELNETRSAVKGISRTIVVVDDSAVNLVQTKAALGAEGYNIICKPNGFDAINYVKENGVPDLMIVDIEMPMINGISLVENLRKEGHITLPIIFLTGVADKETVMRCRSVNACDYILKPANPTYLRTRVAMALGLVQDR